LIVPDASLILEFLLRGATRPDAADAIGDAEALAAPVVIDFEVLSGLRRLALARETSEAQARSAMTLFYEIPIKRYAMAELAGRVWALRKNATVYDASYLALAESLNVALVTCDRKLAAVPGHSAEVRTL
jgi:predicted nucleic acid-binding protein